MAGKRLGFNWKKKGFTFKSFWLFHILCHFWFLDIIQYSSHIFACYQHCLGYIWRSLRCHCRYDGISGCISKWYWSIEENNHNRFITNVTICYYDTCWMVDKEIWSRIYSLGRIWCKYHNCVHYYILFIILSKSATTWRPNTHPVLQE